jgi:membrane protein DedA with SNARE-associated domain
MANIWDWMGGLVTTYGYAGAFLISLFGNFTIFFPVPFTITIYAFGATLNPLLLGLVCGLGSTVGEFSAYLIGRGGRRIIEGKYEKRLESAKQLVLRYGMIIIFLFALLPLPDDLILIPLGMLKYDIRKTLFAAFLGKTLMCIIVAYAGRLSFSLVRDVFESSGVLGGAVSAILLVLVLFAMIRIDWTRFIGPKENESV